MSKSIRIEAGCAVITALVGRVEFNGASMLLHEVYEVVRALTAEADVAYMNAARQFAQFAGKPEVGESLPMQP